VVQVTLVVLALVASVVSVSVRLLTAQQRLEVAVVVVAAMTARHLATGAPEVMAAVVQEAGQQGQQERQTRVAVAVAAVLLLLGPQVVRRLAVPA
jgi:hypothetical protein